MHDIWLPLRFQRQIIRHPMPLRPRSGLPPTYLVLFKSLVARRVCCAVLLHHYSSPPVIASILPEHLETIFRSLMYVRRRRRRDARFRGLIEFASQRFLASPPLGFVGASNLQLIMLLCCTPSAARHRHAVRLRRESMCRVTIGRGPYGIWRGPRGMSWGWEGDYWILSTRGFLLTLSATV